MSHTIVVFSHPAGRWAKGTELKKTLDAARVKKGERVLVYLYNCEPKELEVEGGSIRAPFGSNGIKIQSPDKPW